MPASRTPLYTDWPEAPVRGKDFYHNGLCPEDVASLEAGGWNLVDVRLLSSTAAADKARAVQAYLEGIRVGTLAGDQTRLKFLELEARICGLLGKNPPEDKKLASSEEDVESILDFGKQIR